MASDNYYRQLQILVNTLIEGLKYYHPDIARLHFSVPDSYENPNNRLQWEQKQQLSPEEHNSLLEDFTKTSDINTAAEILYNYFEFFERILKGEKPEKYPEKTVPPDLLLLEEERQRLIKQLEETRASAEAEQERFIQRYKLREQSKLLVNYAKQSTYQIKKPSFVEKSPIHIEDIRKQLEDARQDYISHKKSQAEESQIFLIPAQSIPFPPPKPNIEPIINKLISDASKFTQDDFVQSYLSFSSQNLSKTIAFSGGITSATLTERILRTFWISVKGGRDSTRIARALAGDPNVKFNVSSTFTKDSISLLTVDSAKEVKTAKEASNKLIDEVIPNKDKDKLQDEDKQKLKHIGFEFVDSARFSMNRVAPLAFTKGFQFISDAGSLAFSKENPVEMSAFHLWTRSVTPQNIADFITEAKKNGINETYLKNLSHYGSILNLLEQRHPRLSSIFHSAYRGRYLRFVHAQRIVQANGSFVVNNEAAILDSKVYEGNFFTGIGRQLFGEVSNRFLARYLNPLKSKITSIVGPAFKKATAKIIAKLGIEAVASAAGGPLGFVISTILIEGGAKLAKIIKKITPHFVKRFFKWMWDNKAATGAALLAGIVAVPAIFIPVTVVVGGIYVFGQLALVTGFVAGGVASATGIFFMGLAAIGKELVLLLIQAFATLVIITLVISFIIYIITTSAYVVPPGTLSPFGTGQTIESQFIGVTKVAEPAGPFDNNDVDNPLKIKYTITIFAKRGNISNIRLNNICTVRQEGTPPACSHPTPPQDEIPGVISPQQPYEFSYEVEYQGDQWYDSFIVDTITVTADTEDIQGDVAASSATIKIGDPPSDCPEGWPLLPNGPGDNVYITRGPHSISTHRKAEAIDISATTNHPVTARHNGIVVKSEWYGLYGKTIEIASQCDTGTEVVSFLSRYSHLNTAGVPVGAAVNHGDTIGFSGATGNVTGAHLHYEFRVGSSAGDEGTVPAGPFPNNPPTMDQPYIPKNTNGCGNACGISIP